MGTRAGLAILKDKLLPLFLVRANDEVTALFELSNKILIGKRTPQAKSIAGQRYQSTAQAERWAQIWQEKALREIDQARSQELEARSSAFTLTAPRHQFMDRRARSLALMQDSVHLLGDWHFHFANSCQSYGCRSGENSFRHHPMHAGDNLGQSFPSAKFDDHTAVS
jgi:hypothetical protein